MIRTNNVKDVENLINDKKLFLFDFDGTIAHTERLQWEAYNIVLEKYNVVLREEYLNYIGFSELEIYKMIKKDFNIEFDENVLLEERLHVYLNLVKERKLKPFAIFNQLLQKYTTTKFYILTSNREEVIKNMLEYWNLIDRFEKIISTSKGEMSKQDVLVNTVKFLGDVKSNIVYFEDMDRNLKLGKEQNITTIGIEHEFNEGKLENCDAIIIGEQS